MGVGPLNAHLFAMTARASRGSLAGEAEGSGASGRVPQAPLPLPPCYKALRFWDTTPASGIVLRALPGWWQSHHAGRPFRTTLAG
jgi:hypothetical protein